MSSATQKRSDSKNLSTRANTINSVSSSSGYKFVKKIKYKKNQINQTKTKNEYIPSFMLALQLVDGR